MRCPALLLVASYLASGCGGGSGGMTPTPTYTLTLSAGPNGTVAASPAGPTYTAGTRVTLTATPDAPFTIQSWSGTDDDASTQPVNHVTMSADKTVGVLFTVPAICPADPGTGNVVARMISPANGATLPAGAVTFKWCNASADYFLTVESVPGAHDIFFAAAGGAGGGAGVNTLTLGPACAPAPPTGCIPTNGEPIYVTLFTLRQGNVLAPSPFNYTYTAANVSP